MDPFTLSAAQPRSKGEQGLNWDSEDPFTLSAAQPRSKREQGLHWDSEDPFTLSAAQPRSKGEQRAHMKPFWVYMLSCADGSYYVGHTDDVMRRLAQHRSGEIPGYTSGRLPVKLVFATEMPTRDEAIQREQQIKGWKRAKKEALASEEWDELKMLAKGRRPKVPSK